MPTIRPPLGVLLRATSGHLSITGVTVTDGADRPASQQAKHSTYAAGMLTDSQAELSDP